MDKIPTMAKFQFNLHTSPVPVKFKFGGSQRFNFIYIYIYIYISSCVGFSRIFKRLKMRVRGFTPGKIFLNHALHIAGK